LAPDQTDEEANMMTSRSISSNFWKEVSIMEVGVALCLMILFLLSQSFLETIAAIYMLVAALLFAATVQGRVAATCPDALDRKLWLASAIACLVVALILFIDPLLAGGPTAMALAGFLALGAAARLTLALVCAHPGRAWLYLSGAVGMVVALAIGFAWPFASILPAAHSLALDLLAVATMLVSVTGKAPICTK
jgi:uncharacterized membrane protein HdeD (DUF308 family)